MSELASGWVINVTEANVVKEVVEISKEKPVLVDFWAPWCEPCRQLTPLLEKLVAEKKGRVILAKVNVDEAGPLAQQFQIESIPAVRIIYQGRMRGGFDGVQPEAQLRQMFDQLAPLEQVDKDLAAAKKQEASDPAKAEAAYRKIAAEHLDRTEPQLGIARSLIAQNKTDDAVAYLDELTLEGDAAEEAEKLKSGVYFRKLTTSTEDEATLRQRIDAEPKSGQAAYDLGCLLAARGDYDEALAKLMLAAERDYALANAKVREVMVKIFYALGANHPLANDYRARLATLLY